MKTRDDVINDYRKLGCSKEYSIFLADTQIEQAKVKPPKGPDHKPQAVPQLTQAAPSGWLKKIQDFLG